MLFFDLFTCAHEASPNSFFLLGYQACNSINFSTIDMAVKQPSRIIQRVGV